MQRMQEDRYYQTDEGEDQLTTPPTPQATNSEPDPDRGGVDRMAPSAKDNSEQKEGKHLPIPPLQVAQEVEVEEILCCGKAQGRNRCVDHPIENRVKLLGDDQEDERNSQPFQYLLNHRC